MLIKDLYNHIYMYLTRRSRCEHEWVETGQSFVSFGDMYATRRTHYKCTECGKKEKRPDRDAGTFIMI